MFDKKNDFFNHLERKKETISTSQENPTKKRKLTALISWKIQDFNKDKKSLKFILILYLILFSLAIYGLIFNNLLLSILIILFGFTFFLFEKKENQTVLFAVTKEGIFIHDHLYLYDSLSSFWIEYEPEGIKEISFRNNQLFLPYIKIPLEKTNPSELRKILIKFIPEKKHRAGFGDLIEKI